MLVDKFKAMSSFQKYNSKRHLYDCNVNKDITLTYIFLKIFKVLSTLRDALRHPMFPLFKAVFEIAAGNVSQNCFSMLLNISDVLEPLAFQCDFELGEKPKI